jgi:hypothetical protein
MHRFFGGAQAVSDGARRGFDGSYLQAEVGYRFGFGLVAGLDWAGYAADGEVRTGTSALRLGVSTHAASALVGYELGERVRVQLTALVGGAFGTFQRSFTSGLSADSERWSAQAMLVGAQAGLDVAALPWLTVGARGRLSKSLQPWLSAAKQSSDLGGAFAGLSCAVTF